MAYHCILCTFLGGRGMHYGLLMFVLYLWQVLMPHSTSNGLSYSQKRFRRVAAVFAGIVVCCRA